MMIRLFAEIRNMLTRRTNPRLLQSIGTVTIPATEDPFVVREKFGVHADSEVRIIMGTNFESWLSEKVEEPIAEARLRYADLIEPSTDDLILAELGERAETTLSQLYALLERQPRGQEGVLLTDMLGPAKPVPFLKDLVSFRLGGPNVFYIRDINGELRVVHVQWFTNNWIVDVFPSPNTWHNEPRVFSRDS